jgi:hypothetical protein
MHKPRGFMASLVVAFIVGSALSENRASIHRVVTGTVVEFESPDAFVIANDVMRVSVALTKKTIYESDPRRAVGRADIKLGTRLTVWYRSAFDRHRPADKVRILSPRGIGRWNKSSPSHVCCRRTSTAL